MKLSDKDYEIIGGFSDIVARAPANIGWRTILSEAAANTKNPKVLRQLAKIGNEAALKIRIYNNPACDEKLRQEIYLKYQASQDYLWKFSYILICIGTDYEKGRINNQQFLAEIKAAYPKPKQPPLEYTAACAGSSLGSKVCAFLWEHYRSAPFALLILKRSEIFKKMPSDCLNDIFKYLGRRCRTNKDEEKSRILLFPKCSETLAIEIIRTVGRTRNCTIQKNIAETKAITDETKKALTAALQLSS